MKQENEVGDYYKVGDYWENVAGGRKYWENVAAADYTDINC